MEIGLKLVILLLAESDSFTKIDSEGKFFGFPRLDGEWRDQIYDMLYPNHVRFLKRQEADDVNKY